MGPNSTGGRVVVVGTGLAGLSAALALAARHVPIILVGPGYQSSLALRDTRSTALFGPSLDFLKRIGVLDRLTPAPVPLVGLRLVDATGGIVRAPEVLFEATEIGLSEFGMNIENASLLAALASAVADAPDIRWHAAMLATCDPGVDVASLHLTDGTAVDAELVVGADGEASACRTAAGIVTRAWTYPQTAIASRFAHRRPHGGISIELHRRSGPLTTVPLAENWSSLVWVEGPAEAARLAALDDGAFVAELEECLGGALGSVSGIGRRASFPLSGVSAEPIAARRVALVGEAAHRLPPIGAQGLNLGLRDAAWLADLVAETLALGEDPGGPAVLAAYDRCRRGDVASRTAVVDALNRSLLADMLPVDLVRGAGLAAMKAIGPLRRVIMREGMAPSGPLPTLMKPLGPTVVKPPA
jgi:2-octaprenyl-6-methoxyphenol hydroxylase